MSGSEMAGRIGRHHWEATPLGPREDWPRTLKSAVDIMLNSGHAMQIAWGPARTILYNDAYAPMLGDRHPAALGVTLREAWPDVWDQIAPLVERVFAGETVTFAAMPLAMTRHGRAEETWWDFSYSPVHDEIGAVAGLLNVTAEATGRVRAEHDRDAAEARLRESETRYRALVTAGAQTIYRVSPDWQQLYEFDSGSPGTMSGPLSGWHERYVLPEDRPVLIAATAKAVRSRSVFEAEHRVRRVDGSIGWVLSRAVPLFDEAGRMVEWFGASADMTARKAAEDALSARERFARALVEGVPQLIWSAVEEGFWTWASPQWTAFTGQSEMNSRATGWLECVHPDDRAIATERWRRARACGHFEENYRIRHGATGRYRWFQTRATPVRDETGSVVEWLGTSTDVDDLRSLQERQAVLVGELQHRTFNLMAMVRSMADATVRSSADLADFRERFRERIDALARTQRMLSQLGEDERITVDSIVRGELDAVGALPQDDPRVTLSGGRDVTLRSSTVQTLAMAVHELTTNAVKYGALSQAGATLLIEWDTARGEDGASWLHIRWTETGVTIGSGRQSGGGTGQGRQLIERALPFQLRARTEYRITGDGVRCTIAMPDSAFRTETNDDADGFAHPGG